MWLMAKRDIFGMNLIVAVVDVGGALTSGRQRVTAKAIQCRKMKLRGRNCREINANLNSDQSVPGNVSLRLDRKLVARPGSHFHVCHPEVFCFISIL